MGDALQQDLTGVDGAYSMARTWGILAGTAAILTLIAVFTFKWDQGE